MLDPKLLRNDLDGVARNLARRGVVLDRQLYLALETDRLALQVEVEERRQESAMGAAAMVEAALVGPQVPAGLIV